MDAWRMKCSKTSWQKQNLTLEHFVKYAKRQLICVKYAQGGSWQVLKKKKTFKKDLNKVKNF